MCSNKVAALLGVIVIVVNECFTSVLEPLLLVGNNPRIASVRVVCASHCYERLKNISSMCMKAFCMNVMDSRALKLMSHS